MEDEHVLSGLIKERVEIEGTQHIPGKLVIDPDAIDSAKGWSETKAGITNKLSRGAFAATFFLAALAAIGCQIVRLEDL